MKRSHGRIVTLAFGLTMSAVMILVFMSGRFWGLPLDYDRGEHMRLIELTLPPFAGTITVALYYATTSRRRVDGPLNPVFAILVVAPPLIFMALFAVLTGLFTYANSTSSQMTFTLDDYRGGVVVLLTLLTAVTSTLSLELFR